MVRSYRGQDVDMEKLVKAPNCLQKLDLMVLHELILKKELKFSQDELMAQNGIKYEKKENVGLIDLLDFHVQFSVLSQLYYYNLRG